MTGGILPDGQGNCRRPRGLPPGASHRKREVDESRRDALAAGLPGFTQRGIQLVDVRLDLVAAALVDKFAAHDAAGVAHAVAGRYQIALHAVDALPEHDLDALRPLVQNHNVERLPGFGHAHLDLFIIHFGPPGFTIPLRFARVTSTRIARARPHRE